MLKQCLKFAQAVKVKNIPSFVVSFPLPTLKYTPQEKGVSGIRNKKKHLQTFWNCQLVKQTQELFESDDHFVVLKLKGLTYTNHSVDLQCKLFEWFLYERNIGLKWV